MSLSTTQTLFSAQFEKPKHSQPPKKKLNKSVRSREHLTAPEVESLMKAAKASGRYGHRDATIILLMYRHALRVSEAIALKWDQLDLKTGLLHVNRVKNGVESTHPVRGEELRALKTLKREHPYTQYVFLSERKTPLTARAVHKIIARAGRVAKLGFPAHPHMFRHSCGFYLANKGQDTRAIQAYLGHANINNTVKYTALSANRFKNFWED